MKLEFRYRISQIVTDIFMDSWASSRGTCPPCFLNIKIIFLLKNCRVAEWSALQTSTRGDLGSDPAEVKTFFGGIN